MRIYEQLIIVEPKATEEQINAVVSLVEEVVKNGGGTVEKVDKWGVRKLAYRVKKQSEGFYILIQFTAEGETVKEIERRMRVEEYLIKFISVRIDEKMKWIEKRKKVREKRAARRPERHAPSPSAPSKPAAAVPGKPVGDEADDEPTFTEADDKPEATREADEKPAPEAAASE
jgi:small subunit ribosomal protein S6